MFIGFRHYAKYLIFIFYFNLHISPMRKYRDWPRIEGLETESITQGPPMMEGTQAHAVPLPSKPGAFSKCGELIYNDLCNFNMTSFFLCKMYLIYNFKIPCCMEWMKVFFLKNQESGRGQYVFQEKILNMVPTCVEIFLMSKYLLEIWQPFSFFFLSIAFVKYDNHIKGSF